MLICLISTSSIGRDPRALAKAESMRLAGHEIVGVSPAREDPEWVSSPGEATLIDRLTRRDSAIRLAAQAASLPCDVYQPVSPNAVGIAQEAARRRPGSVVVTQPTWPRDGAGDLISIAPSQPHRARPASGALPTLHTPDSVSPPSLRPGGQLVIAYRKTERNPGRYVEAALHRAGFDVRRTAVIDWEDIDRSTRAVIVVESPLPALPVRSVNPGVPVAFWVHHGEHHLDANLRLQRRYGAHTVLQAHSWHLAYRFTGLVERLPFGVAPEITSPDFVPHDQRRWDVAFAGAADPRRHRRRIELLSELEDRLGKERVRVDSRLSPEAMMEMYRDARVVVDDGAGRHLPITMRVFEATGAGALLFSATAPGVELLFESGTDFVPMETEPGTEIVRLLDSNSEAIARSGHATSWSRHTYDMRVIELMSVIDRVGEEGIEAPEPLPAPGGLMSIVDRFADGQRILDLGGAVADGLPGREVWPYQQAEERAGPGTFHLSVIADGSSSERRRAVAAARLGVITPSGQAESLAPLVHEIHGECRRHDMTEGSVLVFGSSGYRLSPDPDPI